MDIEVSIHGLIPDTQANQQILVLKAKENGTGKFLPIWIGPAEAHAIKVVLEETASERPLTHDLLKDLMIYFKTPLRKVVIHKLVQGTYFANLHMDNRGSELIVDSRPSDAIALAVRLKSPIFIKEEVYLKQHINLKEKQPAQQIGLES